MTQPEGFTPVSTQGPGGRGALGLSQQEAEARLARFGANDVVPTRQRTLLAQLLGRFANPLVIILLLAGLLSGVLGDPVNALIITGIVLLSVALEFTQTQRSLRAAEALRDQVAMTATVLRDGGWREVARREVVPGDLIRLSAGDLIPADAVLTEARDLHVQQAALTGESLPSEKEATGDLNPPRNPEAKNGVFLGSSVVSGTATALVVATGTQTAFGNIAQSLALRPPPNEFERGTLQFSLFITRTVLFLVLFVLLTNLAFGRSPLESFLFAVALAVGLTPEFLPMITTVTLAQGALRMARHKVIVKNLAAIQNFGSIDILCSDKTGTLTSGQMVFDRHLDVSGEDSPEAFRLAYLNSFFETGVKNPLDAAILAHDQTSLEGYSKVDEVPFDFERRRLSVMVEKGGAHQLITKGAPESVLTVCTRVEVGGVVQSLDTEATGKAVETYQRLSGEGYRVLAVAYRSVVPADVRAAYRAADEHDLILLGFVTFADPPLPGAKEALEALRRDGVQVKILTGDGELVARHVCAQVGLDSGQIMLGDEIEDMSDPALARVAEQTRVFARVSPAQKNRVINVLKSRGHVVGYMGDGINDAPSLHTADVGISVAGAVDVAKEAAQFILLESSLTILHQGILEGRKAFGNVMKYLLMSTSSNFGNMFSMAFASLFLPFLPMLPTQILLNNFLYDLSQITIPTDAVDSEYVQKPRRWDIRLIREFMLYIGPISSIFDFLTFYVMLALLKANETLFHTGWFVESLATQTLVIFVIRTLQNPLHSRPSRALALTVIAVVGIGLALPFTPLAQPLGFAPLPLSFYGFLLAVTLTYLALVEWIKRKLFARSLDRSPA